MMTAAEEKKGRNRVNRELHQLPIYHDGLPIAQIDTILTSNGFEATESAIYCGREGRANHKVGTKTYLSFTWHKMEETGRYEIVAYVS